MNIEAMNLAWHTEAGRRANNEDYCATALAPDGQIALLVVADGMGGHAAGEVAARLVVDHLVRAYDQSRFDPRPEFMNETILGAHAEVRRSADLNPAQQGMGATVVATLLIAPTPGEPGRIIVGHVGDSRALQFRSGCVRRLTRDHLFAIEVLGVDEDQAKNHPQGNVLSQALGGEGTVSPTVHEFDLAPNDCILLCTDGVSEVMIEPQMEALLRLNLPLLGNPSTSNASTSSESASLQDNPVETHGGAHRESPSEGLPRVAASLVQRAIRNGSRDNCTVSLAWVSPVATSLVAISNTGQDALSDVDDNKEDGRVVVDGPTTGLGQAVQTS